MARKTIASLEAEVCRLNLLLSNQEMKIQLMMEDLAAAQKTAKLFSAAHKVELENKLDRVPTFKERMESAKAAAMKLGVAVKV